ncbi:MAG: hypothetical protein WKF30_08145 [Pyrinomonadaceae bacterium]
MLRRIAIAAAAVVRNLCARGGFAIRLVVLRRRIVAAAAASAGDGVFARCARKRSTSAAISARPIEGVAAAAGAIAMLRAPTLASFAATTGRVSNAMRLMSIRCSGEILSELTLPPHEPQPSVMEGASAVEKPMAPCVVGVLTTTREAASQGRSCAHVARLRVDAGRVPMPP